MKTKKIKPESSSLHSPFPSTHPFSTYINSSPVIPRGVLQQLRIFPAKPLFHHNAGGIHFLRSSPPDVNARARHVPPEKAGGSSTGSTLPNVTNILSGSPPPPHNDYRTTGGYFFLPTCAHRLILSMPPSPSFLLGQAAKLNPQ
ncbi:hypothetical protein CEXT_570531 [Caerostris extrusa]|uniref:Uncharacterized protein n=1 Tax=Caerostris extrusa TaxID=172846 RepID=A0AAV4T751_CAEEX|nr:hypothetical protein CEXT_570531 [Caerostris extrusa]